MIYVALAIILPFIENFLWGLGLGSILVALVFFLFSTGKLSTLLIVVIALFAVFMDLSLHLPIGSLLIALSVGLILFFVISSFVPVKDGLAKYPALFLVFTVTHLVVGLLAHRQGLGNVGDVLSLVFGPSLRFALVDVVIYFAIDYFMGRSPQSGSKIRLK